MLWTTLLSALVPVAANGIGQVITRFTGGVRPTTVEEQLKLDNQEIERMKVVANLDTPGGTPSQWVVDLRASARYVGALVTIGCGLATLYIPGVTESVQVVALDAANIAFGFLFGSRIVASWKK